ncbi:hypothetical protein EDC04DRAFT_2894477 [Pisolithus marmoratus]|nr:hypothetical protein EDC04DRAFT_2894477 [Pisolithus marmoratus]
MAHEYPMIKGLFTGYQQLAFLSSSIEAWYDGICCNHITCHCIIIKVIWYKKQNGVEHEFLWFNIFSPDKKHIAIVIAKRASSIHNTNRDPSDATQPANTTIAPIDAMTGPTTLPFTLLDVTGDSATSSDDEHSPRVGKATKTNQQMKQKAKPSAQISSISSSSPQGAHNLISYATLGSAASAELEQMCNKATRICGLKFSENDRPSANELATLLDVTSSTSQHTPSPTCNVTGAEQDTTTHQGGRWNGLPIHMKESLDKVCAKYHAAQAALLKEIELKCRVEHQQEDKRWQEHEQCQAAEEAAKWECKKCQAVEDAKQRERKKHQIAEDATKPSDSPSVDEPLECPIKDECDMFFKLLRGPASEPAEKLLASMDLDRELQALWRYL